MLHCFLPESNNSGRILPELKEDIRKLTQNHDILAKTILRKCRDIKNQIVTFHKTELGQYAYK